MPARQTVEAFRANLDDPRHGTDNGYSNLRCRCDRCREAHRVLHMKWRRSVGIPARRYREK